MDASISAARSASRNFDKRNLARILGIAYLLGGEVYDIYFDHGGREGKRQYLARRTSQE